MRRRRERRKSLNREGEMRGRMRPRETQQRSKNIPLTGIRGGGGRKAESRNSLLHHEIKQPRLEGELMGLRFLFFKMGIGV